MLSNEELDRLCLSLLDDGRVLSVQENNLLAQILRRSAEPCFSPGPLRSTITRLAGEVIAQRISDVFGARLAEHAAGQVGALVLAPADPPFCPPGGPPKPPGPTPPFPGPPAPCRAEPRAQRPAALEHSTQLESRCVVLHEFLAPAELDDLMAYVLRRNHDFRISEVVAPGADYGTANFDHRRSRVLMDLGEFSSIIATRIRSCLPQLVHRLGHAAFSIANIEAQITASNHGDFFRWHNDNLNGPAASRKITFVYFFHREPKAFGGGELRLYDSHWEHGSYAPDSDYYTVVPRQNEVVFFDSSLAHEITLVQCAQGRFEDSRFTINGWVHA
jgi:hypothetical protein